MRAKNLKILRRKQGKILVTLDQTMIFLDMTLKAEVTKEKIDKLNCLKVKKKFLCFKGPKQEKSFENHSKRHPTEHKKIFVNNLSDSGLVSRMDEELLTIQQLKDKLPNFKMGQVFEQLLLKRHTND